MSSKLRLLFIPIESSFHFLGTKQQKKQKKCRNFYFSTISYLIICRHVANREKLCELLSIRLLYVRFAVVAGKNNRNAKSFFLSLLLSYFPMLSV